ncbi:MAG: addiction module protein [Gemmataceae bacterium]
MTMNLESFGLDRLNADAKLSLAGQLWDSVFAAEAPGALLSDAQREELRRRVAEAEAHPEDYVNWSDALANTFKRLSR